MNKVWHSLRIAPYLKMNHQCKELVDQLPTFINSLRSAQPKLSQVEWVKQSEENMVQCRKRVCGNTVLL